MNKKKIFFFVFAFLIAFILYFLPMGDITPLAKRCLSIFVLAAILWFSEAVPLYVTSFIILFLETIFLKSPGLKYKIFVYPFFSPVIVLFLGGYILSTALHKYNIDKIIAKSVIKIFGTNPYFIALGLMLTTAFLSMWMSNTATTAMMITVSMPILYHIHNQDKFRKLIILSIPFAANIGGIATPIGTPPNAIAFAYIKEFSKSNMSFLGWMKFAFPISIFLLLIAWLILIIFFKPQKKHYEINIEKYCEIGIKNNIVIFITILTILLWLTSFLHKIPSAIVALIPIIVFLSTNILNLEDFKSIGWDVLMLIGGGLSLGVAMTKTGLSTWIISKIHFEQLPLILSMGSISTITVVLSSFMSNTATTNLLMPIVTKIPTIIPIDAAISVALAASVAMILPISTPPNAIAYGTKEIKVKDMMITGGVISIISLIILIILGTVIKLY